MDIANLTTSQYLQASLMRLVVILIMWGLILYNEMYQHLEDLHNSVNQYFPSHQCMILKNYTSIKDLFTI